MKKILIIVPDGGMLFESAGIADILMQANRLHPEGAREICYQVKLATTQPHQVIHGQSGLNLLADHRLHEIDPREPLDTIMITGRGQNPQEGMAVVDWLRLAAPHARRIVSICGGAMLLAQTGLLDGRRATTHWKLLETMQAEFPQIRVEGGPLYIQDEHIWTSGGVSSGFDLTLALVEEDYGFSLARDIAPAWPPRGSVWSRLTRRWIVSPSKRDLAAVLTCDACLRNSLTSLQVNIVNDFTVAKWRKVILFCHLRHNPSVLL